MSNVIEFPQTWRRTLPVDGLCELCKTKPCDTALIDRDTCDVAMHVCSECGDVMCSHTGPEAA